MYQHHARSAYSDNWSGADRQCGVRTVLHWVDFSGEMNMIGVDVRDPSEALRNVVSGTKAKDASIKAQASNCLRWRDRELISHKPLKMPFKDDDRGVLDAEIAHTQKTNKLPIPCPRACREDWRLPLQLVTVYPPFTDPFSGFLLPLRFLIR